MERLSGKLLVGALALALLFAFGCGGDDPPELPISPIDTPQPPPPDNKVADLDPATMQQIDISQYDPNPESVVKDPRVLRLGREGALKIKTNETINYGFAKDFTLELWVMPMGKSQPQIVSMDGLRLSMQDGRLRLDSSGEPLHGPEMRSRDWHHIAVVVVGQQLTLYVNGQRAGLKTVDAAWAPSGDITLGFVEGSTLGPFVGMIDNLRLAQGARYKDTFLPSATFIPADAYFAYDFNGTSRGMVFGNPGPTAKLIGNAQLLQGSM